MPPISWKRPYHLKCKIFCRCFFFFLYCISKFANYFHSKGRIFKYYFQNVIVFGLTFWLWVISSDILMRFFRFNGSLEACLNMLFGFSKQLRKRYPEMLVGCVKDVQNPISVWTQFLNKTICCWPTLDRISNLLAIYKHSVLEENVKFVPLKHST